MAANSAASAASAAAPLVQVTTTGSPFESTSKGAGRLKMNWITLGISVLVGLGVFVCISMVLNLKKKVTELENREAIDELVLANAVRRQVVSTFQDFQRAQVRAAIDHDSTADTAQPEPVAEPAAEPVVESSAKQPLVEPPAAVVDEAEAPKDHEAEVEAEPVISIVPPSKPAASSKRGPGRPKATSTNKDDN